MIQVNSNSKSLFLPQATHVWGKRVNFGYTVMQFNIDHWPTSPSEKRVRFKLDKFKELVTYSEPPAYPVGDWWDIQHGLHDSNLKIKFDNIDLALHLGVDDATFFEFVAWNEVMPS